MVTCPGCGAIVFVDMEGMAHVASDQPAPEPQPIAEPMADPAPVFSAGVAMEPFPMESTPFEAQPFADVEPSEPIPSAVPDENHESSAGGEGMDMNAFLGYEPDPDAPTKPNSVKTSQLDPNDPLGISAYANSEHSSAPNGPLVVSIVISGIDAKDLRDEIRQALQDSRFGWDVAVLMSGIKGGVLRIDRISPVKATVILNRIKNLSVQIHWEQNAITEIDPSDKEF